MQSGTNTAIRLESVGWLRFNGIFSINYRTMKKLKYIKGVYFG